MQKKVLVIILDRDVPHIYRVEALDSTGKVIGVSNEETI